MPVDHMEPIAQVVLNVSTPRELNTKSTSVEFASRSKPLRKYYEAFRRVS